MSIVTREAMGVFLSKRPLNFEGYGGHVESRPAAV